MRFVLVSWFNGISTFDGYVMSKPPELKNSSSAFEHVARGIKEAIPFQKAFSMNVNIAQLEFKPAFYNVTVQLLRYKGFTYMSTWVLQ